MEAGGNPLKKWLRVVSSPKEAGWWTWARTVAPVVFFILGLLWTSLRFVVLPGLASSTVTMLAEEHFMDLTVEDWDFDVANLEIVAHDVVLLVDGSYLNDQLLSIDQLAVDLSWWRRLRRGSWVHSVTVRSPRLYFERPLAGLKTNWSQLGRFPRPTPAQAERFSAFQQAKNERASDTSFETHEETLLEIPRLKIEGMTIESVERLPGNSGGGVIHEQLARLFLDDVEIIATDLVGLWDGRRSPSTIELNGRVADGKVSLQAQANLFEWAHLPPSGVEEADLEHVRPELRWSPSLTGALYLENIGAVPLARLIPKAALKPESGSLSGNINFALARHQLTCDAEVQLNQFAYAANPEAPALRRRRGEVERGLRSVEANGRYSFDCSGSMSDDTFRPLQSFQARTTREAVRSAPRVVRAAAVVDEARYSSVEVPSDLSRDVRSLAQHEPNREDFGFSSDFFRKAERVIDRIDRFTRGRFGPFGN